MRLRLLLLVSLLAFAFAASAQTDSGAKRKIAVLPILNLSGEKWEDLKKRQIEKATQYTLEEFVKRGFELVDAQRIKQAIEDSKIDFTDEEQQKRSVLFDLGKKLEADFVLLAIITGTEQKKQDRTFYQDTEGMADVKIWFLDLKAEKPVLSAKTFTGRSGGNRMSLDNKGSDRQVQAAANAMRDALKDFFAGYPVIKK